MNYYDKSILMLKKWINYSLPELYSIPSSEQLLCYGTGYNGWGLQAHQKALSAFAVIATLDDIAFENCTISKTKLIDISLSCLRFMLESHIEGSASCTDNDNWGHTWISALGTERAWHAIETLLPYMTKKDKLLLKKVIISEADWLLDFHEVLANEDSRSEKNHPESNIWNGLSLFRAAAMYPDSTRCNEYKRKAEIYLANGISVPLDKNSNIAYDGKEISKLFIGNNFYSTYALDHHGYLNIGYMVICLSNLAMYYFSCKRNNYEIPNIIFHNAKELWSVVKSFIGDDGRLIRIGGDSRVRYCYCQDYLIPAVLFAQEAFSDTDAENIKTKCVDLIYKEFLSNNDGSFVSDRCSGFKKISPVYYTRLESDKACVLSMLVLWDKSLNYEKSKKQIPVFKSWSAPSHGAEMVRSKNRFASFSFKSAEGLTGIVLPNCEGNYAEWKNNLSGEIQGSACINKTVCTNYHTTSFDGGFLSYGIAKHISEKFPAEQQKNEVTAIEHIMFSALPDDSTVITIQYAYAPCRTYLLKSAGINLNIPNDIFNDFKREYYFENGEFTSGRFNGTNNIIPVGNWINIDNKIGIISSQTNGLNICRPGRRQIENKYSYFDNKFTKYTGSLSCDSICSDVISKPCWKSNSEMIFDTSCIITVNSNAAQTRSLYKTNYNVSVKNTLLTRSITVKGKDGIVYSAVYNLSEYNQTVKLQGEFSSIINICTGERPGGDVVIAPYSSVLFKTI